MTKLIDPSVLNGKVGLFGGSFDPIHSGHIQIAKAAKEKYSLSSIVFIPAWKNPLKEEKPSLSGKERAELIQIAISCEPGFYISDFEINQEKPSYTIDTIRHFKSLSGANFYFLLGSDSLADFTKWREYDQILKDVELIVYERRGSPAKPFKDLSGNLITGEWIDISSSFIRSELDAGRIPKDVLPSGVEAKIREKKLYGVR